MPYRTTRDVADEFHCSLRKVYDLAHECGVGFNLRGGAGWRFSEADVEAMRQSMAPTPPVAARRRPRRRSA